MALDRVQRQQLKARKKASPALNTAGGALGVAGLGALALGSKRGAAGANRALKAFGSKKVVSRPRARAASTALGTAAIGVGSVNAFNTADIQRKEAKLTPVRKSVERPFGIEH